MNKQSNLSRLMSYAGAHKYLTYASWILSALSSLVALIPFWYIWQIIREVLRAGHDFSGAAGLERMGWLAVLFAVLSVLVYICGLMCSHLAAFRIAPNIRIMAMEHIIKLPPWFCRQIRQRTPAQDSQRIQCCY